MRIIVIPLAFRSRLKMQNVLPGLVGGIIPHSCCLLAMALGGLGAAGAVSLLEPLMSFRGPLFLAGLFSAIVINRKHIFKAGKVQITPLLVMLSTFYLTYKLVDMFLS